MIAPKPLNDAQIAFGDISNLPPYDTLPEEYRRERARGCDIASRLFFEGGKASDLGSVRDGISQTHAWRAILACLRSFEPKHEYKIAGTGFLIDQWFEAAAK